MYARVATFQGADEAGVKAAVAAITSASGPPEGVESTGITVFADTSSGKVVVAGFFATREALDRGHAALSKMSPPAGSFGELVTVDLMEVVAQRSMPPG